MHKYNNLKGIIYYKNLLKIHGNHEKKVDSGPPLRYKANELIKKVYEFTEGKITIIGVGGSQMGKDAFEKISLGASLIQLYTSLIMSWSSF